MALAKKTTNRIKPELPGGFKDYPPELAIAKQRILDTARRTFELFCFEPTETSAMQKTEVLTGGEQEAQKIIFNVSPSVGPVGDDISDKVDGKDKLSLRFDLTVPLARFIAANPDIPKPFKRYEIGRVWRGERQQAGRYREFTQADVDIVGSASPLADAEIVAVIYTTLKNLGIADFVIKINDRKEFDALPRIAGFPEEKLWDALRIADKKDKIGEDGVKRELSAAFDKAVAAKIEKFFAGPLELPEMKTNLDAMKIPQSVYRFDRSLVRGLSYYTGAVFEAVLPDASEIGSVFGGGRYDNLVMNFTGQKIPAVGASLGVDRLIAALEKLGKLEAPKTIAQVIILDLASELKPEYMKLARRLRDAGINTSLYLGEESMLKAQLSYAVKKEIPYVLIYGPEEKKKGVVAIKNLVTREQKEIAEEKIAEYIKPS